MADPKLVALRLKALQAQRPAEEMAYLRQVRRAVTADGYLDLSRGIGAVPEDAVVISPDQLPATNGSGFDTTADQLDASSGTYAPIASPTFTGTLTAPNVTVTTALTTVDLTATGSSNLGDASGDVAQVWGHFKHKSSAPSIATGVALGTGGSVGATLTYGSDQAGRVSLVAGTTSLTTGVAATITLATARPTTNYAILLRGGSTNAEVVNATAAVSSTTQWTISFQTAPGSGVTYGFFYWIVEVG